MAAGELAVVEVAFVALVGRAVLGRRRRGERDQNDGGHRQTPKSPHGGFTDQGSVHGGVAFLQGRSFWAGEGWFAAENLRRLRKVFGVAKIYLLVRQATFPAAERGGKTTSGAGRLDPTATDGRKPPANPSGRSGASVNGVRQRDSSPGGNWTSDYHGSGSMLPALPEQSSLSFQPDPPRRPDPAGAAGVRHATIGSKPHAIATHRYCPDASTAGAARSGGEHRRTAAGQTPPSLSDTISLASGDVWSENSTPTVLGTPAGDRRCSTSRR